MPPEGAAIVLLEVEQAVAENPEAGQRLADLRFDGAEILADNDYPVTDAFQCQDLHEIQRQLLDVGALGSIALFRDPVEPEEPHDVVDAQRASVAAVLANGFGKKAVAVGAVLFRIRRREAPVLS